MQGAITSELARLSSQAKNVPGAIHPLHLRVETARHETSISTHCGHWSGSTWSSLRAYGGGQTGAAQGAAAGGAPGRGGGGTPGTQRNCAHACCGAALLAAAGLSSVKRLACDGGGVAGPVGGVFT